MKEILSKRKEAERQKRVGRILRASRKLFLKKGYTNTTMRDVCREAALSTGAVYFYFNGKDEIYASICEETFRLLLGMFREAHSDALAPLDNLIAMKDAYLAFYTDHYDRWVMLCNFRTVELPDVLLHRLEELDAQGLALLYETVDALLQEKGLSQSYDCREVSVALWASVEGLLTLHHHGQLVHVDKTLEEMVDMQHRIFIQGL
ncbi:MAG: TetR/AcrR family transcriptional regulator [Deltaproteobacteria bacterium]|nr:TetR/AcrR family transcriptional regulator [Deltaproteobacteria bacterium]